MSSIRHRAAEWVKGAAIDDEVAAHDERMAAPWTMAEYQRLLAAVEALTRSRTFVDGGVLVDSRAWWRLLGALGRDGMS